MKAMFLCKRCRPNINPVIAFLNKKVQEPDENDWSKLARSMNYL